MEFILREAVDEWRVRERNAAYNSALICATLCNLQRDEKRKPKPFLPEDFLPTYENEDDEPELSPSEFYERASKLAELKLHGQQ